jgi:hypothetical protein
MKKIIFLIIAMFCFSKTYALLPPLFHTLSEIETIISDERLVQELGSAEGITKLEKVEGGYLITTFRYQLKVDVNYLHQEKIIGPAQFDLVFHKKTTIDLKCDK